MFSHQIGRLAVRDLPNDFTLVEIDCRDGSVGWLDQRQPVHVELNVFAGSLFLRGHGRVSPRILARPVNGLDLLSGRSINVTHIRHFFRRLHQPDRLQASVAGVNIRDVGFGIVGPARPIGSSGRRSQSESSQRSVDLTHDRWGEDGTQQVFGGYALGLFAKIRREVNQVIYRHAVSAIGGRLARYGLCRRVPFTGHTPDRHRLFGDGPHRLACYAVEKVQEPLLARLGYGLDRFAVNGDVGEYRSRRDVHVPKGMMHQLKMPFSLSGPQVHTDQTFSKKIITAPMPSVEVACRRFDRKIDETQLLVHGDLRPHSRVAGIFRRTIEPGVVPEFSLLWNGVEDPQALAGAHIRSAHVALVVAHAFRGITFAEGSANDDGVPGNNRS